MPASVTERYVASRHPGEPLRTARRATAPTTSTSSTPPRRPTSSSSPRSRSSPSPDAGRRPHGAVLSTLDAVPTPPLSRAVDGVRLHVVTGKGGVGKTTVAAALALALTRAGQARAARRGRGPPGHQPDLRRAAARHRRGPPRRPRRRRRALGAVGRRQGGAARVPPDRSTSSAAPAAPWRRWASSTSRRPSRPGVRDVLLTGKVYEAVGRTTGHTRGQGPKAWDAVVLDAPPTGRDRPLPQRQRAGRRPRQGRADPLARPSRSPGCCATAQSVVHVVTLLEEMPVQETVDAVAELSAAGFGLGAVVVNQVREPLVDEALLEAAAAEPDRVDGAGRAPTWPTWGCAPRRAPWPGCSPRRTTTPSGSPSSAPSPTRSRRSGPAARRPARPRRPASRTAASRSSPTSSLEQGVR